jgi:peptidyl-prolyl cis-trans isomerase D
VVLGAEVREAARLSSEERRVAVLERKREAVASSVTIDDEAIRAFYEANKEQFKTARRVRVRYIELTRSDLVDQVEVPESEIRAEYEANQEQYKQATERQASHILIEVPDDAGGDVKEKARKRAERLVKRIKNGADFAALAREHSDDPGSASNGGDLGYIGGGDMVAPFEQALFQMDEAGTVTGPVETKYGYHIIRLEHIREPEPKPFEAVREQIRQRLAQQRAERLLYDRVEVLKQEAYENPASLKPAAEAVGLEVQESDWLARDQGEGVASAEAVRQAAFSDSVLQEGRNSDVVEPGEQRAVVLRVAQERPPETKPLEAVRAEVRQQLETQRVQQALVDWSENAIERLRNGTDAETLADGERVRLRNVGWMSRDGGDLGRRLTQTAFETPPPGSDGASYEATDTSDGRVIVMVAERRFPEPGQDALDAARERLRRALSRAEGRTWIEALKSEADIVRHEQPANPNTGGGSG